MNCLLALRRPPHLQLEEAHAQLQAAAASGESAAAAAAEAAALRQQVAEAAAALAAAEADKAHYASELEVLIASTEGLMGDKAQARAAAHLLCSRGG